VAAVRGLGGTESALFDDRDVLAMVLPAIRNDYVAAETYRYRPGPGCAARSLRWSVTPTPR
jgi:surfactin synthase thioesterase subunit